MKIQIKLILSAIFFLFLLGGGSAGQTPIVFPPFQETEDLATVRDKAIDLSEKYGADGVLVVFDIDNTILIMSQNLGGVAWYIWQDNLKNNSGAKVGNLLNVQGILYALSDMNPTEKETASYIDELNDLGIASYALSARGPNYRDSTERVLKATGINFEKAPECGPPLCVKRGFIDSLYIKSIAEMVLGKDFMSRLKGFKKGRNASVSDGVMLISGQHKGVMLRLLTESLDMKNLKAIVFVDDRIKNVDAVIEVREKFNVPVYVFYYTRYNDKVATFLHDRAAQDETTTSWDILKASICSELKPSWCNLN